MLDRYHNVTKYTERLAAQFLELVARGHTVAVAAQAIDVTPGCIQLWRRTRPGFDSAYQRARRHAEALPTLPDGVSLIPWERMLVEKTKTHATASASAGR